MSRSRGASRQDRRRAELEERRAARRAGRRNEKPRSLVLPLSIGALVLGVVAVIAFALVGAPPAGAELREPARPAGYGLADGQALGRADAPLALEVYSDFQCPACGTLATTIEPLLVRDYVEDGRLRIIYRDFAFLGNESVEAAVGARCAANENRFWQFHDYLFANQQGENRGAFSASRLAAIARAVGLDEAAYASCMNDAAQRQAVLDVRAAADAVPVQSTPTLVLNGEQLIVGVPRYAELQAAIEALLAGAVAP